MASCEECRHWKGPGDVFATKVGFKVCQRVREWEKVEGDIAPAARNNKHDSDEDRTRYWEAARGRFEGEGAYVSTGDLLTHKSFVCGRFTK
jgi:hypothetical protein